MARDYTNKVIEMMFDGERDPAWLAQALASWLSEADMHEFYNTYLAADADDTEEE